MDDLEKHLRSARLAPPSADLDRRVAAAFASARPPVTAPRPRRLWWPAIAGLAAACLIAVLPIRHPATPASAPPPAAVVYEIETQGALRALLLSPGDRAGNEPRLTVHFESP